MPPVFGMLFDGVAYGMLLFLMSVGLSVTLGMMNFVNLAHCSFAMLGGYVTVTLINMLGWPFLATLPVSFIGAAVASVALERLVFRRFYNSGELNQCILSIGVVFVSVAAAAYIYGTDQQPVQLPAYLQGSIRLAGLDFPVYRLFLIVAATLITIVLVLTLETTRFGAQVRAAVNNQRMARGLGIDVDTLFAVTFALGGGLAGLGGGLAIAMLGLDPSFAITYLIYVLIVVSVGGLGSIAGTFVGAMVLGVSDMAGKYYIPALGSVLIYLVMLAAIMWRPAGLFGRRS
jgi:branched-chain amino acid transport system permease protein